MVGTLSLHTKFQTSKSFPSWKIYVWVVVIVVIVIVIVVVTGGKQSQLLALALGLGLGGSLTTKLIQTKPNHV